MSPDQLAALLDRLAADLEALQEPWVVFGSAAMVIRGMDEPQIPDLDIFTTEPGAAFLESAWARWRSGGYQPDPDAPFRSRFSRYEAPEGVFEVMGGLRHRTDEVWTPVTIEATERLPFRDRVWPVATTAEHARILRRFGRTKDLARAARLEALAAAG
jgi:hypothetical protein